MEVELEQCNSLNRMAKELCRWERRNFEQAPNEENLTRLEEALALSQKIEQLYQKTCGPAQGEFDVEALMAYQYDIIKRAIKLSDSYL